MKKRKEGEGEDIISDILGSMRLNILGIDIGKIVSLAAREPEKVRRGLEQLRYKLEQAGGRPVAVDYHFRMGGIAGERFGRPSYFDRRVERVLGTEREAKRITISSRDMVQTESTADVIERGDRVHVITQIPYEREQIKVSFGKREKGGDLTIEAPKAGYKRLIPIDIDVDVPKKLRWSYKSGVVEVILRKAKKKGD